MNRFVSAVVDFGFECMFVAVCHFGTSYCFFSIIIITIIVIVIIVNGFIAKRKQRCFELGICYVVIFRLFIIVDAIVKFVIIISFIVGFVIVVIIIVIIVINIIITVIKVIIVIRTIVIIAKLAVVAIVVGFRFAWYFDCFQNRSFVVVVAFFLFLVPFWTMLLRMYLFI